MEEERQMNLIHKLAKIRTMSDAVSKEKQGYKYKYADITEILAKITAGMKKYGVSLIPSVVPETMDVSKQVSVNTKIDKTGKSYDQTTTEMLVTAEMSFKWINDDNPEDFVEVPWVVIGSQSDPSQAFGSGLTYCTRYFLCNYFQIAQPESDVDAYRSKQKEAEVSENKAIADEIIARFDNMLKIYLSDNQDKSDEVKKFISKYAKKANYFTIKEPNLAVKLMNDFRDTYMKEKERE